MNVPIFNQVDHIVIWSDAGEPLCKLLSQEFQLPIVMPFRSVPWRE